MNENYTILIVDDEPNNIASIIDILDGNGWNLLVANNGEIAIKLVSIQKPDLVLMDWDMPILNGIEATKRIKSNIETAGIPIILISGIMTSSENLYFAFESGAIDFVRKPYDKIELIARVKSMLLLSRYYKESVRMKNKELTSALLQLSQKNDFNFYLVSKLESIINDKFIDNANIQLKLSDILSELKSNSKIIDWNKFNDTFIEANPNFFKQLAIRHSDLTPAELKLCALLRLNLNTKEIASILCQTIDSVRVSRTRLRKKLIIDSEENLVNYLLRF